MNEQKTMILGKQRPSSARPKNIHVPAEIKNENLICIKRNNS